MQALEHLSTTENVLAMVEAITKVAEPGSAVAILARQSLALLVALQNDLACEAEGAGSSQSCGPTTAGRGSIPRAATPRRPPQGGEVISTSARMAS